MRQKPVSCAGGGGSSRSAVPDIVTGIYATIHGKSETGIAIVRAFFSIVFACAAMVVLTNAPARAGCERQGDQRVEASGAVDDAWLDRAGRAMYLLDSGDLACATEGYETYVRDPHGNLQCRAGQHMTVVGRLEPVWFDYTGSGYFIRAERVTCS